MDKQLTFKMPAFILALLLALGLATQAQAAGPVALLEDAYATLAHANHDYKGHRVRAMEQIRLAAKELGGTISGKGKGHEPQATSDAQLKAAIGLLQQAGTGLAGAPLKHINNAIAQLNTALSIR